VHASPRGTETILVVEDEESLREIVVECLRECSYSVLAAADAQQAIEILGRGDLSVDLLLTDLNMPRMSGRELVERVMPTKPALRVLYMSGNMDDSAVPQAVLERAAAFIQKPFSLATLGRKVREVLDTGRPLSVDSA